MNKQILRTCVATAVGLALEGCVPAKAVKEQPLYYSDKPVVMFVVDTSGSMDEIISGEKKIDTAKTSILNTVSQIDKGRFNTSVITFNSGGNCTPSVSVEPNNNDVDRVATLIRAVKAEGPTPLAQAIALSGDALKDVEKKIVILFSDGKETCSGDPVHAARTLDRKYGIKINLQVIGYAVDDVTRKQLKEIASISKEWNYYDANDKADLVKAIDQISKKGDLLGGIWKDVSTARFQFETGSSHVREEYADEIAEIYSYLKNNSERILIEGHTDSVGTQEFNQELSISRANSVKEELVKLGISADRIFIEGKGESTPTCRNDTAECRQQNRRVVIRVIR